MEDVVKSYTPLCYNSSNRVRRIMRKSITRSFVAKAKVGATGAVAGVAAFLGGPVAGAAIAAVSALVNKANKKEEELSSKAKSE